jgi:hypothetical protein
MTVEVPAQGRDIGDGGAPKTGRFNGSAVASRRKRVFSISDVIQ